MKGMISNIQRYSLHDGPGIRTTVFLKGCNMRCFWCHNPESLDPRPQIQFVAERCVGCGRCVEVCNRQAHTLKGGRHLFDRSRCVLCGKCVAACDYGALVMVGTEMETGEVMKEVLEDREFYRTSGGGVTLSGGEPLMQQEFTLKLLEECRKEGLHTAVESNLCFPWRRVSAVIEICDLLMMDLKLMDEELHERYTGFSNRLVLENLKKMSGIGKKFVVRTPVVPGVNDREQEIAGIAELLSGISNLEYYELLPFHPLGMGKYEELGMECKAADLIPPDRERMEALDEAAKRWLGRVKVAGVTVGASVSANGVGEAK
jgi:pyruvate formate lyase activating enzyme